MSAICKVLFFSFVLSCVTLGTTAEDKKESNRPNIPNIASIANGFQNPGQGAAQFPGFPQGGMPSFPGSQGGASGFPGVPQGSGMEGLAGASELTSLMNPQVLKDMVELAQDPCTQKTMSALMKLGNDMRQARAENEKKQ